MIKIFIGLGNPGKKYRFTRHNIGALVIENYLDLHKIKLVPEKDIKSMIAKLNNTIFSIPLTYMNESGIAVKLVLNKYNIKPSEMVIIVDDVNLVFGNLRLKPKGSSGGHKGLESIISKISTDNFPRFRIGIGPKASDETLTEFVLGKFNKREIEHLSEILSNTSQVIDDILCFGIEKTMEYVNRKRSCFFLTS